MDTENWKYEIDLVTEKFSWSFGSLNEEQLNWKVSSTTWSVAQNIDHLIKLNGSYFKNFDEIKQGKHEIPDMDGLPLFLTISLEEIEPYTNPNRIQRTKTLGIWEPGEDFSLKIWEDFTKHQSDFKRHITELQPFFNGETLIKFPGETDLIFGLEECIDFLIAHENRHWNQAMEVKENQS